MRYALAAALLLLVPADALAQQTGDVPAVVSAGLDAYRQRGADAALDVWLDGWAPGDAAVARPQLLNLFTRLDQQAGPMVGHDIVGVAHWGTRARRVFAVMLYDAQPVYARFDVFRPHAEWQVANVTVNSDPAQILPPSMLAPRESSAAP